MRTLYFLLMILLLASCEKEIDIKYHDIEPLTVIEAELTPEGAKVAITLTTPMTEPMNRTRLTDAAVTLTDLTDGTPYTLQPDADGYYTDPTPGIAGHTYLLSVEREGCRYESETTMFPPSEIVSLEFNWIKMPYDHVAVFQGQFRDNTAANGDCYWVKLYRNGEIYLWSQTVDHNAVDGVCSFTIMTSRRDTDEEDDDEVLFDGDVVTFTVTQISRQMHDYLEALRNGSNGPAIFSDDKCLGYFIASSPVTDSIVFHPYDIPEYK